MPIVNYPFTTLGPFSRPMLPIIATNPNTGLCQSAWALIDTGADECAFPANFAALMGHNFALGNQSGISTGNGVASAYSHTTQIDIYGLDALGSVVNNVVHTVPPSQVHYMQGLTTVLLGVQSFLGNFILTVNYSQKIFSVKAP